MLLSVNFDSVFPPYHCVRILGSIIDLENLPGVHFDQKELTHADIVKSMAALIAIGKPYYDAIELIRPYPQFFIDTMDVPFCPSSATLRQRLDLIGQSAEAPIKDAALELIKTKAPALTPIETSVGNFLPLDIDVSPFDNSKTQKEGTSRTYKGCDGYAPIFAYLGTEGYLVNLEQREGSQHCQKNTPEFIIQTIINCRELTDQPILMRLDSGNDSKDNFPTEDGIDFIIKRNLRREPLQDWLELAQQQGDEHLCRDGKRNWTGITEVGLNGKKLPYPIVFDVTERTSKKGQQLAFAEIEVDTYWCSLEDMPADEVIFWYHDHGTSEQFHSELKTDLDLERLPSGKFATNSLILTIGMLTYNCLKVIGQHSLKAVEDHPELAPVVIPRQKPVKRRRIRTVMQDFICTAGRIIDTARSRFISLGRCNPFSLLWQHLHAQLALGRNPKK